jgi:hypothetical protein
LEEKKKINECLEAKIVLQRKEHVNEEEEVSCLKIKVNEEEKREEILTSHLKEIYEGLRKHEVEFNQQEKGLEEEIISLKTQFEETKRMKELMKIQMMKKEEENEKLEE